MPGNQTYLDKFSYIKLYDNGCLVIIEIFWDPDVKMLVSDRHNIYISMLFKIFNTVFKTDCFQLYRNPKNPNKSGCIMCFILKYE